MPRVFVSYSHDTPEHRAAVRRLCDALRAVNFDVVSDGYTGPPGAGWFDWSVKEIEAATHVLTVCTPTYRRRFENDEVAGAGYGVSWEARALRQHLVPRRGVSNKVIPVLLDDASADTIPGVLAGLPYARVKDGNVRDLAAIIRGLPQWLPKPQGSNWVTALALALPGIVGFDRFLPWVKTTLGARPCRDDETADAYAESILLEAQEAGRIDEELWRHLMERYSSHAEELQRILEQWRLVPKREPAEQASEPAAADDEPRSADVQGEATHTSIVLDRTQAWRELTSACRDATHNLAFIVHGTSNQDLHLFLQRVELFLHDPLECERYHVVKRVRSRSGLSKVVAADEWKRATLEATQFHRPSLEDALAHLAIRHPVMLLLGGSEPFRDLDTEQRDGLADFVTRVLPAALAQGRPRQPVHVLVPIEIPHEDSTDLVEALEDAFEAASPGLSLHPRISLKFPDWIDVKEEVKKRFAAHDVVASEAAFAACRRLFEEKTAASRSLRELGDALHHLLFDLIEAAQQRA